MLIADAMFTYFYVSCLYFCYQHGAFWVKMCPSVSKQWTTPLIHLFIHLHSFIYSLTGFSPRLFERGFFLWEGETSRPPSRKKNQSFKFECLKWPILAEITAESEIYSHFFCQQGRDIPPVFLRRGSGPPPPPPWRKPWFSINASDQVKLENKPYFW